MLKIVRISGFADTLFIGMAFAAAIGTPRVRIVGRSEARIGKAITIVIDAEIIVKFVVVIAIVEVIVVVVLAIIEIIVMMLVVIVVMAMLMVVRVVRF